MKPARTELPKASFWARAACTSRPRISAHLGRVGRRREHVAQPGLTRRSRKRRRGEARAAEAGAEAGAARARGARLRSRTRGARERPSTHCSARGMRRSRERPSAVCACTPSPDQLQMASAPHGRPLYSYWPCRGRTSAHQALDHLHVCAGATLTGGVSAPASAGRCRTHQCGLNEGADAKVDRCAAGSGRPASGACKALASNVLRNWVPPSRANHHWCSGPEPLQPRPTGMDEGAQSRAGGGGGTWRRTTAITAIQWQKLR